MPLHHDQPLFRPPAEADNLIIQATYGCSFNRCSFCAMYRGKDYLERPLESVVAEIREAAEIYPDARRVFLADGDALALPTAHLVALLRALGEALPRLTRVTCYATPSNISGKSLPELQRLRAHGLTLLYLGIESGSDLILKKVTKGATRRTIAEAMLKASQAGLKVSGTVILGLGGTRHWQAHIDGTIALLNESPLTHLSTLQLYLDARVREEFEHRFGEPFEMPDDRAILREQERLIADLNPPQRIIFRSNHASNALALAGNLPTDRDRLLRQIDEAVNGSRPLRPHHLRGL